MRIIDSSEVNRSFYPRRGRVSQRHEDAISQLYPRLGIAPSSNQILDTTDVFGRDAPLVIEIGSGMGDATLEMAAADPDRNYIAIEVHPPGIGNLLARTDEAGVSNLRVHDGDALFFIRDHIRPASVDAFHVFFPDPWPKARHHKRRLIQPERVELLVSRLWAGGILHCATDWSEYAEHMLETLDNNPRLVNQSDGYSPRPAHRPSTKFEQRGIDAGREIFDLMYSKITDIDAFM